MLRGLRSILVVGCTLGTLVAAVAWQAPTRDEGKTTIAALQTGGTRWFKGNLHTHSLWSDGDDFPEMIADWYKRNGYHFLTLSEHNVLAEGERWLPITEKRPLPVAIDKYRARFGASWVELREADGTRQVRLKPFSEYRSVLEEPGRFLLIPGEEITHQYAKLPVHINAINLRDLIKPLNGGNVAETISVNHRLVAEQMKKAKQRMVAFLNHPNFQWGVTAEDMLGAPELRFFEVFNGHPGVRNEGDADHPSCERLWDIALAVRLGKLGQGVLHGLATDDAHGYHVYGVGKVNPGRGWIMVRSPYLTPEGIVKAIDAGDFYASSGVTLEDVKTSDGELALTIRAEPGVLYRTEFVATLRETPLDSKPRLDKNGKPVNSTRIYDGKIGQIVATSTERSPRYKLTGKEHYVRARVVSSKPHPNPYKKGDVEMAWTQPVVPVDR